MTPTAAAVPLSTSANEAAAVAVVKAIFDSGGKAIAIRADGAVKMFTQGLARELGARGVTVNHLQPGPIDTEMNPAGAEWSAGPESGYVNGASLTVDGGTNICVYDGCMNDRHHALWNAVEQSVLQADGKTPSSLRQAAARRGELPAPLAALVDKIHRHAYRIIDEDLTSLRAHYSEDELFEIIVAAAFGAATTRLQAGLRALEEA